MIQILFEEFYLIEFLLFVELERIFLSLYSIELIVSDYRRFFQISIFIGKKAIVGERKEREKEGRR